LESQRRKSAFKFFIKIALSALAIYLVFKKIDLKEVWSLIRGSHFLWIALAFLAFNASKVLSAYRLLFIFRAIGVDIGFIHNLRLYYVGMFYNLFLPGGVGGDGYKVFHLKSRSEATTRKLLAAVLLDRISGAALLAFLAFLFALFIPALFEGLPGWVYLLDGIAALTAVPALMLLIRFAFPSFRKATVPAVVGSLGVQLVQLLCAFAILKGFGVNHYFMIYFVLFLVSSIAAMLPLSFGGVGLRELVFLYASTLLPIDETSAVALGLMFFLITAISSFIGVFLRLPGHEK
jgi:hypothetical protein